MHAAGLGRGRSPKHPLELAGKMTHLAHTCHDVQKRDPEGIQVRGRLSRSRELLGSHKTIRADNGRP